MWKIIDQLGLLFVNFFNAVKFAAYDYDAKLKMSKTPRQRAIIWTVIVITTIVFVYLLLSLVGFIIKPLINRQSL